MSYRHLPVPDNTYILLENSYRFVTEKRLLIKPHEMTVNLDDTITSLKFCTFRGLDAWRIYVAVQPV